MGSSQVVGNGGLAGTIGYAAMGTAVRAGFAAASTDTGHTSTEPETWLGDRERVIDYSYRGLHLTTVDAKSILQAYYTSPAKDSYYTGCSTGGKQGLMEAQRFPADFDGILAGDAANFWTHQMASEVWNGVATSTPETNLPKEKLQLLENATVKACDMLDGAADGLVSDPTHCHFDPAKLQCPAGADSATCLTAAQVGAVKKLYGGITDAARQEPVSRLLSRRRDGLGEQHRHQQDEQVWCELIFLLGQRRVSHAGLGIPQVRLRREHRSRRCGARADHERDGSQSRRRSGKPATN